MGAKPGQNNFKSYQKKNVKSHAAAIQVVLDEMPSSLKFNSSKALASYVAEKIGVHRTTVTRNGTYMGLVRTAFSKRSVKLDEVDINNADASILREVIALRDITIANQAQEIERLKRVIQNSMQSDSSPRLEAHNAKPDLSNDKAINSIGSAFMSVIEHFEKEGLGIVYNRDTNEIVDEHDGRVICDKKSLEEFADFIESKTL